MKGKGRPTDKLSKISEGSTFQQYSPNPPLGQSGRVSLSSLATRKPERKISSVTIRQDELTLEERDAKIKGLQETIMDKK